jgi:hypothetical protein
VNHLITFRIIIEGNDKIYLLCCFVDFRKDFEIVPRTNLWNRLEELKVPFELRFVAVSLYEKVIFNFRNTKCWSEEMKYNIIVKQGCPLSPTLFEICIDKL